MASDEEARTACTSSCTLTRKALPVISNDNLKHSIIQLTTSLPDLENNHTFRSGKIMMSYSDVRIFRIFVQPDFASRTKRLEKMHFKNARIHFRNLCHLAKEYLLPWNGGTQHRLESIYRTFFLSSANTMISIIVERSPFSEI